MGTLNVYVGQKKIFTKSGNQGNQWLKAAVNVTDAGATEVSMTLRQQTSFPMLIYM